MDPRPKPVTKAGPTWQVVIDDLPGLDYVYLSL